MQPSLRAGQRLPPAYLARLGADGIEPVHTEQLFLGVKAAVLGVPGAFTPICTHQHLPDFIAHADRFRAAGFQDLICIATSDPFSLAAWAKEIDPEGRVKFFSDGNLAFTRACGLASLEEPLFLGERSRRYMMVVENAVVRHLKVEASVLSVTCTRANDVLELD